MYRQTYEKIEGTNDYKMEEVPISTIQIGDMIEVRAGEKIPVDGVLTQAESFMTPDAAYVDEAMISVLPAVLASRPRIPASCLIWSIEPRAPESDII